MLRGFDSRLCGVRVVASFRRSSSSPVAARRKSLARALPAAGWQLTLAGRSLGQPREPTHAASFFDGIDVHALDYSPADDSSRRSPRTWNATTS